MIRSPASWLLRHHLQRNWIISQKSSEYSFKISPVSPGSQQGPVCVCANIRSFLGSDQIRKVCPRLWRVFAVLVASSRPARVRSKTEKLNVTFQTNEVDLINGMKEFIGLSPPNKRFARLWSWMNFSSRSIYFQAHCETVRADVQIEPGPNGGVNHRGMPRLGWPGTGDWWAELA